MLSSIKKKKKNIVYLLQLFLSKAESHFQKFQYQNDVICILCDNNLTYIKTFD